MPGHAGSVIGRGDVALAEMQPETGHEEPVSRTVVYDTTRGKISIRTHCPESFVASLGVDEGIGLFFHYRASGAEEQHQVLRRVAAMPEANVVLAFTEQRQIVGYVGMHPVSEVLRWGQGDTSGYYEFGAIEVSRNWRGLGLARKLVETAFADEWLEDKIVISHELSWHWDLVGTGLSKGQYRKLLYDLLSRAGFMEYPTDEGNIRMDPYNLFTARIGKRVSKEPRARFIQSLFVRESADSWWLPADW
jgi:acetoin utilization protein AcuA